MGQSVICAALRLASPKGQGLLEFGLGFEPPSVRAFAIQPGRGQSFERPIPSLFTILASNGMMSLESTSQRKRSMQDRETDAQTPPCDRPTFCRNVVRR